LWRLAILIGLTTAVTLMALGVEFGYLCRGNDVLNLFVQRTHFVLTNDRAGRRWIGAADFRSRGRLLT
jgi:hypothetical protein